MLEPGAEIARIQGGARAMLTAERVALNFLCHLSGVATATASIARAVAPYGARVTCTRKTMPGLRALQKYAVRVGGGSNHRFGLDDAVLIKDNHIAFAGGIANAVARARAGVGHMVRIELEVDTLEQLETALALGVDVVLLDNMSLDDLRRAVAMARGRAVTEAWPHHARDGRRDRGDRGGPDRRGLADAQRQGAGHRPGRLSTQPPFTFLLTGPTYRRPAS